MFRLTIINAKKMWYILVKSIGILELDRLVGILTILLPTLGKNLKPFFRP